MAETTVAIYDADQWAERLLTLWPQVWSGDESKKTGGLLYSLFNTVGKQYEFLEENLDWVLAACRLQTARDKALDTFAADYFGKVFGIDFSLERQIGEPDVSFRKRIYDELLQSGGNRNDVDRSFLALTGVRPRIIEPWSIEDTCAADGASFCDIDTYENPCRVADLSRRFMAFVESPLPPYGANGENPIYGVDVGFGCDRSFIIDSEPTWFLGEKQLDATLQRLRMANTIIYRNYGINVSANYARGGSIYSLAGISSIPVELAPPCPEALVVLASAAFNSKVSARVYDTSSFSLELSEATTGIDYVDWIAAPATLPGFGLLPISPDATNASLLKPIDDAFTFVTPSWNTNVWINTLQTGALNFGFSAPGIPGAVLYYGSFEIPFIGTKLLDGTTDEILVTLNVPAPDGFQLMVLPSWNTSYSVTKTSTTFTIKFVEFPPADSYFYWGVLSQPF